MTALYKWLNTGKSCHGGSGAWRKNRWRAVRGDLVPCENGLHLCREKDLLTWITAELWVAEADLSEMIEQDNKVVVRKARVVEKLRWDEKTARLFAADCVERVLPLFEREHPDDSRPRDAILAARAFAHGEVGREALAAAWAAAWDAAGVAAWYAAWNAAGVAAWYATWNAAGVAARAAAGDAARVAARDAARAAAWAAAWYAARAAAGAAAGYAARAAAGDAARAEERQWQTARLLDYAHGRIQ